MPAHSRTCDLAVIGAGPAGAALALLAARAGASVLLVERSRFDAPRIGETAPPEFRHCLERLGVGDLARDSSLAREAPAVASAWGEEEAVERHHICSPYGPALHLDRARFDRALAQRAEQAGAHLRTGTKARVVSSDKYGHVLSLGTKDSVRARYVAIAVGRAAGGAGLGRGRIHLDDHVCLHAMLSGDARDDRTLIEAVPEGWFYAAALPGAHTAVGLTTRAANVPKGRTDRLRFWMRAVRNSDLIAFATAGMQMPSEVVVAISTASAARRVGGPHWCVIGDARIAPDPLSGQGLLWALDDAELAAEHLLAGSAADLAARLRERSFADLAAHATAAARFYGAEERFPHSPFWSAKHINARPPRALAAEVAHPS